MIQVDSRIGSSNLIHLFSPGITELTTLDSGDFAFIGNGPDGDMLFVGVERKTYSDLLQSLASGRLLAEQLPKMQNSFGVFYLVIEGIVRTDSKTGQLQTLVGFNKKKGERWYGCGVQTKDLHSRINTLDIIAGVKIRYTSTPFETAKLVEALYSWWSKPFKDHHGHTVAKYQVIPTAVLSRPSLVRRIAAELPGVGIQRSADVAKKCKTVQGIVEASIIELATIPGIGAVTAKKIYSAVRGE